MKNKQMQRDIIGACIDCRKYYQPSCSVYKQENKRPGPGDWCYGFKKKIRIPAGVIVSGGQIAADHRAGKV